MVDERKVGTQANEEEYSGVNYFVEHRLMTAATYVVDLFEGLALTSVIHMPFYCT